MAIQPIQATQVSIDYRCPSFKKVRAIDTNGREWENFGDEVAPGLLAEVCAKLVKNRLAGQPTIDLTTDGTFLIQSA